MNMYNKVILGIRTHNAHHDHNAHNDHNVHNDHNDLHEPSCAA